MTIAFIATAAVKQNQGFLFHSLTLILLMSLVFLLDKCFNFSLIGLWGFNLWMVMLLAGGLATVNGVLPAPRSIHLHVTYDGFSK